MKEKYICFFSQTEKLKTILAVEQNNMTPAALFSLTKIDYPQYANVV